MRKNRCCNDTEVVPTTIKYGPMGPTGATGLIGPTGPVGVAPNINATIFCDETQNITSDAFVTLNATLTENNVSIADNKITISSGGIYLISYSLNKFVNAGVDTDYMAININGVADVHTRRPIGNSFVSNGTIVMTLVAGDVIGLITNISQGQTITNNGGPSAMLTIAKIADEE